MATKQLTDVAPTNYGSTPNQITMSPALECLRNVAEVEVQEKANLLEVATALLGAEIEMANKYRVFAMGAGGEREEIFYVVEQTGCCTRQLKSCCPDCAPWDVNVMYTQGGRSELAFKLERPCTYTCCCFNRPVVDITHVPSGEKVGSIRDPFACCDLTFSMMDGNGADLMKAKGGCCQLGLCCPLPCGPCAKVTFEIERATGEYAGQLVKKVPSCLKWCFADDVDNYKITMDAASDPQSKLMMIVLSVFVDFRYFSENSNDDIGSGHCHWSPCCRLLALQ